MDKSKIRASNITDLATLIAMGLISPDGEWLTDINGNKINIGFMFFEHSVAEYKLRLDDKSKK